MPQSYYERVPRIRTDEREEERAAQFLPRMPTLTAQSIPAFSCTRPPALFLSDQESRLNVALSEHEETLAAVRARLAHPPASVLPGDPAKASL